MTKKKTILKDKNYIAFDFETTGLDIEKDEPIQIGLVQFDANGKVLNTYSSLIKPKKSIDELKGIVRFLTGFKLEDLEEAPSIEDIIEEIRPFFTSDKPIIAVGQNISFDCAMLQKYCNFPIETEVDTYPLSKVLIHHLPSYALDVIHEHLVLGKHISPSSDEEAHDALHDSFMSYDVFLHLINKTQQLRHDNLILDYVFENSNSILSKIIRRSEKKYNFSEKELFLPPLQSSSVSQKKLHTKESIELPDENTTLGTANISLSQLIKKIDRTAKQRIITCSHPSKQRIIENHLNSLYLSYGSFSQQVIFDKERVNAFLQKGDFDDDEVGFVLKYCSQHAAGHGKLDINSGEEYKIFSALTDRKPKNRSRVTVASHSQLWYHADKVDKEDAVLFLDHDWWYKTYNHAHRKPFDPYYMLQKLEHTMYAYEIINNNAVVKEITTVLGHYTMFMGVFYSEIDAFFKGYNDNKREFDTILENPRFPKTRKLFPTITERIEELKDHIDEKYYQQLAGFLKKFKNYLTGQSVIEKRMYDKDKWRYILHHNEDYVDYNEFLESLPEATYYFCSNNKERDNDITLKPDTSLDTKINLQTTPQPKKVLEQIKKLKYDEDKTSKNKTNRIFILSTSKSHSQELFQELVNHGVQDNWTVVAENITGGVGKGIFHATHSDKPVIALGGYNFYMSLLAKKFAFSDIFLYHLYGSMKQQLVQDLVWYAT